MEALVLKLASQGVADHQIAQQLTAQGYRSPLRDHVLASTVQAIRLKHRLLLTSSQSHSRRIAGYLTVPQVAKHIGVSRHWIYDRIHNGRIQIEKDACSKLYLLSR